jgi:hypothetical protein
MMTREEIMKKLAEIKGTMNDRPTIMDTGSREQDNNVEPTLDVEDEPVSGPDNAPSDGGYRAIESVVEVESFRPTPELIALAQTWQAEIGETGKLVCNKVDMNRKDYLKHTRTITQEQLLDDPLMYVLFRSEEQPEGNFFHWLERFPRAKA